MKNLFKENKFIFQETLTTLEVNSSESTKKTIEEIQKEPNIEKRKKDFESEWSSTLDFPVQINGKTPEEIKKVMITIESFGINIKEAFNNPDDTEIHSGSDRIAVLNSLNSVMEISMDTNNNLIMSAKFTDTPDTGHLIISEDGVVSLKVEKNDEAVKKINTLNETLQQKTLAGTKLALAGTGKLIINPTNPKPAAATRGAQIKSNIQGGFDITFDKGDAFQGLEWTESSIDQTKINKKGKEEAEKNGYGLDKKRTDVLKWKSKNDSGIFIFSKDADKPGFISICESGNASFHDLDSPGGVVVRKPVIYLYPEKEEEVTVTIDFKGEFTTVYPQFKNGEWNVIAKPDGTLHEKHTNRMFKYLFWEGIPNPAPEYDFSTGFCIHKNEAEKFLETKLKELGLTANEYNDMIVYWLPFLEQNEYSLINFAGKEYTDTAKLNISPEPDSVLRVFMVFKKVNEKTKIKAQKLKPFKRNNFTVVEWGGANLDEQKEITERKSNIVLNTKNLKLETSNI